jgi:hypothetical protein
MFFHQDSQTPVATTAIPAAKPNVFSTLGKLIVDKVQEVTPAPEPKVDPAPAAQPPVLEVEREVDVEAVMKAVSNIGQALKAVIPAQSREAAKSLRSVALAELAKATLGLLGKAPKEDLKVLLDNAGALLVTAVEILGQKKL